MKANNASILYALGLCWVLGCGGATSNAPGAQMGSDADDDDQGEGVPNTVVNKKGSGDVSARFGPPGGTLELSDGPRVEIPSGCVEDGVVFVLKTAPMTTAFLNEESERPLGPPFVFSPGVECPDGRPIVVSFPLASYPDGWGEAALAYEYPVGDRAYAEDSQHTKWQVEPGKLQGGRAMAQVPALNGMRLQFTLTNLEAQ